MNIVGTGSTASVPSEQREYTERDTSAESIPIQTLRGGDASDIVPEDVLRETVAKYEDSDQNVVGPTRTVRGEFAELQRVLETRIARFDAELDVAFEDTDLIIYRLETEREFEYILDFCEVENARSRQVIVTLMRTIATDRTAAAPEYPLVVRKPLAFRAGERHARTRSSQPDHRD